MAIQRPFARIKGLLLGPVPAIICHSVAVDCNLGSFRDGGVHRFHKYVQWLDKTGEFWYALHVPLKYEETRCQ